MNIVSQLIRSNWLWMVLTTVGFALPAHIPGTSAYVTPDHVPARPSITYDVPPALVFGYDSASMLATDQSESRAAGIGSGFAKFGELLAAEGEGMLAGSIRNVNPRSGSVNCVNCAIASEYTLRGAPASALPTTGPLPISLITKEFGGSFTPVSGPMEIGSILSRSGEGASGVVFGQGTSMNHVWNVVNQGGNIRFLDGQIGGLGVQNFELFKKFQFLLTTPGR